MPHCNQCAYEWEQRDAPPKSCPRCKRYDWNEPKKCGRVSFKREIESVREMAKDLPPLGCAKCGSLSGHQKGCKG